MNDSFTSDSGEMPGVQGGFQRQLSTASQGTVVDNAGSGVQRDQVVEEERKEDYSELLNYSPIIMRQQSNFGTVDNQTALAILKHVLLTASTGAEYYKMVISLSEPSNKDTLFSAYLQLLTEEPNESMFDRPEYRAGCFTAGVNTHNLYLKSDNQSSFDYLISPVALRRTGNFKVATTGTLAFHPTNKGHISIMDAGDFSMIGKGVDLYAMKANRVDKAGNYSRDIPHLFRPNFGTVGIDGKNEPIRLVVILKTNLEDKKVIKKENSNEETVKHRIVFYIDTSTKKKLLIGIASSMGLSIKEACARCKNFNSKMTEIEKEERSARRNNTMGLSRCTAEFSDAVVGKKNTWPGTQSMIEGLRGEEDRNTYGHRAFYAAVASMGNPKYTLAVANVSPRIKFHCRSQEIAESSAEYFKRTSTIAVPSTSIGQGGMVTGLDMLSGPYWANSDGPTIDWSIGNIRFQNVHCDEIMERTGVSEIAQVSSRVDHSDIDVNALRSVAPTGRVNNFRSVNSFVDFA